MPTVKEVIDRIQRHHPNPKEHVAVATWSYQDVQVAARTHRGIKLRKKQAEEIIDDVDRHWDATIGISWDTLDAYIDNYLREQEDDKDG